MIFKRKFKDKSLKDNILFLEKKRNKLKCLKRHELGGKDEKKRERYYIEASDERERENISAWHSSGFLTFEARQFWVNTTATPNPVVLAKRSETRKSDGLAADEKQTAEMYLFLLLLSFLPSFFCFLSLKDLAYMQVLRDVDSFVMIYGQKTKRTAHLHNRERRRERYREQETDFYSRYFELGKWFQTWKDECGTTHSWTRSCHHTIVLSVREAALIFKQTDTDAGKFIASTPSTHLRKTPTATLVGKKKDNEDVICHWSIYVQIWVLHSSHLRKPRNKKKKRIV